MSLVTSVRPEPSEQGASRPEDRRIARARAGDLGAFEGLYRDHVGRVYALCLRMLADPVRAEEATQEIFVRAWRRLDTFEGRSALSTWLHRLAVNVVLDEERARKRRASEPGLAGDEGAELPEGLSVASPHPGERIDLERAIARLPRGARMAFVLHDVEGYKHREIAQMMGLAEGTCKAQLHRARTLLREELER